MEGIRRFLSFSVGLIIVFVGVLGECPRFGAIVIGLLLMGMFSVPEAFHILKVRSTQHDRPEEEV